MDAKIILNELNSFMSSYGRSNIIFRKDLNNFIFEMVEKIEKEDEENGKKKKE